MTIRLLWGSPLPPTRSGVSDYAVELLPELARRARVRVVAPPGWQTPEDWPAQLEVVPTTYAGASDEVQLLHLGNNPHHEWLLKRLGLMRTVIVLHDLVLHHLLVEALLRGGRAGGPELYEARLAASHGEAGAALARARRFGITGHRDPFLFPSWRVFLERSSGVVVHSEWACNQVRTHRPGARVRAVGLPVADPGHVDARAARARLGIAAADVVIMHLGFLTSDKGVRETLAAVAAAVAAGVPARLVLVGEGALLDRLGDVVEAAGLTGRVMTTGWVRSAELARLPAAADLGVVLRTPSAGETSAAALRFLACGTPAVVNGHAQFLEWPEAAAPRVTPGPGASAELARWLATAATERRNGGWEVRRRAARAAYEAGHQPSQTADALIEFLTELEA